VQQQCNNRVSTVQRQCNNSVTAVVVGVCLTLRRGRGRVRPRPAETGHAA
jgi:hypothetical protein